DVQHRSGLDWHGPATAGELPTAGGDEVNLVLGMGFLRVGRSGAQGVRPDAEIAYGQVLDVAGPGAARFGPLAGMFDDLHRATFSRTGRRIASRAARRFERAAGVAVRAPRPPGPR